MAGAVPSSFLVFSMILVGDRPAEPLPDRDRLEADVRLLAGPEYEGRGGDGARAVGDLLASRLETMGLRPGFGDRFIQEFDSLPSGGRNVGAILPGGDPDGDDEWVIVSAHYDHLGLRSGRIFPGADDNASGVAMVLEVARCLRSLAEAGHSPSRSILFVFFDREEQGLLGSRAFVRNPPVPIDRIGLFITADMLGRSLLGLLPKTLFVMGTEHASALRPMIAEAAESLPIHVATIGADVLFFDRSDYGPFRLRQVPFLFFTTGQSRVYHTPDDVPETIDYDGLRASATLILGVVERAASADALPGWSSERTPWVDEARTIRRVFRQLLEHPDEVPLSDSQRSTIATLLDRIDGWIAEGTLSPADRFVMIRTAQVILFTIL